MLGLLAGIYSTAFMIGVSNQRVHNAIRNEISHIQVHAEGFTNNYNINIFMENVDDKLNTVNDFDEVITSSKRFITTPLFSSGDGQTGGRIVGVEPEKEKLITDIHEQIEEGIYLDSSVHNKILIGRKMADELAVDVGRTIIIRTSSRDSMPLSLQYEVCGIYNTKNDMFDGITAFVLYSDFKNEFSMPKGSASEVAILIEDKDDAGEVTEMVAAQFPGDFTQSYTDISPEIRMLMDSMDQYMMIFIILILLALCFGIINTMLMVVLERVKEIGMLKAIGMNSRRIFKMIMLETVMLAFTGGLAGIVLGYILVQISGVVGIDLSLFAEGMQEIGITTMVYPVISFAEIMEVCLLVILTGVFSALYPAYRALKINPAETVRSIG